MNRDANKPNALKSMSAYNVFKSFRSSVSILECPYIEDQIGFADVIVAVANKFECPINIDVCTRSLSQIQKPKKPERKCKITKEHTSMVSTVDSDSEGTASTPGKGQKQCTMRDSDGSVLMMTTGYNLKNCLVEISINRYRYTQIPRTLMQVLAIVLPKYENITKFTIKDCYINKYTIPELTNILAVTNITEVCLDASFLPEGNYDVLLDQATSLQTLSLKRCKINDEVCKHIVSKLHYQQPAENKLLILNLSSNHITDEGAKSIGKALRTNRHLRYLNLADNLITDIGAKYIFESLAEFLVTKKELIQKRQLCIKYFQHFQAIKNKGSKEFENSIVFKSMKSSRRKTSSIASRSSLKAKSKIIRDKQMTSIDNSLAGAKLEMSESDLQEPFEHPFHKSQLILKDDQCYCKGNLILSYLNLAYNNLTYPSLNNLLAVLEYQNVHKNDILAGLIKVVIDGNNLPVDCTELDSLNVIFKEITRKLTRNKTSKGSIRF